MRHWKRVVAVLLVAAVALVVEGWAARAQAATTLFKNCQYARTPCPRHTRAILECGVGRPGYHFPPELTGRETYLRGTVALSNTPGVGNTSTFFILPTDATLPQTSTTIGKVTTGTAVLDRLSTTAPATIQEILIG